jgi:hypothetical protein
MTVAVIDELRASGEEMSAWRKRGVADAEMAVMRRYEAAVKAGDMAELERLKTATAVLRESFPWLETEGLGVPPDRS